MEDPKIKSTPVPIDNHVLRTLPENPKIVYDEALRDVSIRASHEQLPGTRDTDKKSRLVGVPKTSRADIGQIKRLISVKELAAIYRITSGSIYALIKAEPDFPYVNVGLKKKFLIDVDKFERWYLARTAKEKHEHFSVPTSIDLEKAFKNSGSAK